MVLKHKACLISKENTIWY